MLNLSLGFKASIASGKDINQPETQEAAEPVLLLAALAEVRQDQLPGLSSRPGISAIRSIAGAGLKEPGVSLVDCEGSPVPPNKVKACFSKWDHV